MEPLEPWSHKLLFIFLLAFGCLLICLCCYKISNLLYVLYRIDDDESSKSCSDDNDLIPDKSVYGSCTCYKNTINTRPPEMFGASSTMAFKQNEWNNI